MRSLDAKEVAIRKEKILIFLRRNKNKIYKVMFFVEKYGWKRHQAYAYLEALAKEYPDVFKLRSYRVCYFGVADKSNGWNK